MMPPRTARARAGLIAVEQGLLGLAAGVTIVAGVTAAMHGLPAVALLRPAIWLAAGLALFGVLGTALGRMLRWGLDFAPAPRLEATWVGFFVASCALLVSLVAALIAWQLQGPLKPGAALVGGEAWTGLRLTWVAALPSLVVLALLALRGVAAAEQSARAPVAEVAQPVSQALLGGVALLLLVGVLTGQITAELTYHMGAAVTVAAAATILWTGLSLRSARRDLLRERAAGRGWPLAERGYMVASAVTLLGLVLPAMTILADLLSARLTGMVVACVALAVSNHALRFGWVLLRCGTHRPGA